MSSDDENGVSEFGIQPDGSFRRKHIDEIQESLIAFARQEWGEDIDLAPGSPWRQLIDVATIELADLWESLQATYHASYFPDAWGEALDRVVSIAGVGRLPRRGATGEVKFTASAAPAESITIPASTRVTTARTSDRPRIPFKTTEQAAIPAGATEVREVPIRALEPWETDVDEDYLGAETNVDSGTISRIVDPVAGVTAVTNPLPVGGSGERLDGGVYNFIRGRDRETDAELRHRYRQILGTQGSATLDAIRSHVYSLDGVDNARIEENTSINDNTGSGGLPPKSFRITALADSGQTAEIAQAILDTRPAGIESYGDESGTANDGTGTSYSESFNLAGEITIHIHANLTVDSTWPTDGKDRVRQNIIQYIGGVAPDGTEYRGTSIGEDIVHELVWAACHNVDGVWRADVDIGTSSPPSGSSDITITDGQEVGVTTVNAITIPDPTVEEVP